MKARASIAVLIAFVVYGNCLAAAPKRLFDVVLEDIRGGGRALNISFYDKIPRPDQVDMIIRESLNHAILVDATANILVTGFHGDDVLGNNQYSGSLIYVAHQKKVMTLDEFRGVKFATLRMSDYFVEVEEHNTAPGIKLPKKWLFVTIVFPKPPTLNSANRAIVEQANRLQDRHLDMTLFVDVGDQNVKTSWQQMKDADGTYVFAEYGTASHKLTRRDQILR